MAMKVEMNPGVFLIPVFLFLGCGPEAPAPAAGAVTVAKVDLHESITQTGEVKPAVMVDLKSQASGMIKKIHVVEGQQVAVGDTIVTIDQSLLRLEHKDLEWAIRKSRVEREKMVRQLNYATNQFEIGALSKNQLADLDADLRIHDIQMQQQKLRLEDIGKKLAKCIVRSPMRGTVTDLNAEVGEIAVSAEAGAQAGTLVATIADLSRLEVEAEVSEVDYIHLRKQQKVRIRSAAIEGAATSGTVSFISLTSRKKANSESDGFKVVVAVDSAMPGMAPGIKVYVDFIIQDRKGVLGIPYGYVVKQDSRYFVLGLSVGAPLNTAPAFLPVQVGDTDYKSMEIRSGLAEGSMVFLPGTPPANLAAAFKE